MGLKVSGGYDLGYTQVKSGLCKYEQRSFISGLTVQGPALGFTGEN